MKGKQRHLAGLAALTLLLAACTQSAESASPGGTRPSAAGSIGADAQGDCEADAFGCAVVPSGDPILVGTALTLSGPDAAIGLDAQFGAQVALNLRGQVLGHDVQLVNEDDACSADGGTSAAVALAQHESLVGVVGTTCSEAALPAADLLGERGILLVSPSNTSPVLAGPQSGRPFYARVARSAVATAVAAAQFACRELAAQSAATLHDGSSASSALEGAFVDAFESECQGTVTARREVAPGEDLGPVLGEITTSADGSPPELLFNALVSAQAPDAMQQASSTAGLEEIILVGVRDGPDGRSGPYPIDDVVTSLDGVYLSGVDRILSGDFYESIFLVEYAAVSASDQPLAASHAQAYDAVNLLLDAVEAVAVEEDGTLYVPRAALREALLGTSSYQGLSGELRCRPSGECATVSAVVWVLTQGKLERAWP